MIDNRQSVQDEDVQQITVQDQEEQEPFDGKTQLTFAEVIEESVASAKDHPDLDELVDVLSFFKDIDPSEKALAGFLLGVYVCATYSLNLSVLGVTTIALMKATEISNSGNAEEMCARINKAFTPKTQ